MNVKALLITFLQCCMIIPAYAQRDSVTTLSGIVYNAAGSPVIAATVSLCYPDSSIAGTTQTDTSGAYQFKAIKPQDYLLVFRHMNYHPKTILLRADTLTALSGYLVTILDGGKTIGLSGVNIIARRKSGLEKIPEGFSFHVDERFSRLTVWETLKQTPLLDVRDDGTLNVLGKTGAVVYINGRKSNLSGNELQEMLRNMSSENLQDIDIITSPSSKYEAQGNGGIINLVLKKQLYEGWMGSVSLISELAYHTAHRANVNLNYARGKISSQLSLRGARNENRITEKSDILLQTLDKKNNSFLDRHEWRYPLGATWMGDLAFTDRHRLNVQANVSYSSATLDWNTANRFSRLHSGGTDSVLTSFTGQDQTMHFINADVNDQIKLDTLGSYISAGISFFTQRIDNTSPYEIRQPSGQYTFQTTSLQQLKNYAGQLDYHQVFRPALSMDAGARVTRNESSSLNKFAGNNLHDLARENDYDYRETIYALYSSLSWQIMDRLGTVLGFRLEQTDISGFEAVSKTSLRRHFTNVFPNISFSWDVDKNNKLGLNISSRINRPGFWELNPTPVYSAPTLYYKGNAFLMPARALNVEFSYMLHQRLTFLLNFNRLNNDWMQFQITHPGSDTVAYDRFNYGRHHQYGLGMNYNDRYLDGRLHVSTNLGLNYYRYSGAIPIKPVDVSSWQLTGRFRGDVDLDEKGNVSVYVAYFYYSPLRSAQGYDRSRQLFEAGGMLKMNKFVVQVSGRDIFNTGLFRFDNENLGISDTRTVVDNSLRRLVITLSYNFGNKNTRKAANSGTANEEQKSRLQY